MKISGRMVERGLWYAFLVTFAWQTRLIFWHADTVFNEWRSASLYLTDVLMLVLFVSALIGVRGRIRIRTTTADVVLALFFFTAALSLVHARALTVGVIQLIRLAQFIAFFYYLRHWAWHRFDAERSALAFVIGALVQSAIGIGQYVVQHDLGIRWLGETLLRTDMRGVAVFYDAVGEKILRAYGTLPHPNILAAYLTLAFWLAVWLWIRHWNDRRVHLLLWQVAISVLLIAQYLTFSRTIVALWLCSVAVVSIALYLPRYSGTWQNIAEIRRRFRGVLLTVAVVSVATAGLLWPQVVARMTIHGSDEAVRLRVLYNNEAVSSGSGSALRINWTGVGIGNFTTWLAKYDPSLPPHLVQPAHNIYLMAYSEIGLLGLVCWLAWLVMVARMMWRFHHGQPLLRMGIAVLVVGMLGTGLLDHFYWTLQQGRLLWWGILALAAGRA